MCEQTKALNDLSAAARALTLACMRRTAAPAGPFNQAYDHVACEPLPDDMAALIDRLGKDVGSA